MLYQLSYVRALNQDSPAGSRIETAGGGGLCPAQPWIGLTLRAVKEGAHGGTMGSPVLTQLGKLMLYQLSYVRAKRVQDSSVVGILSLARES
jgi:hypothetical protein